MKAHKSSKKELQNLFGIVERDSRDARIAGTSADARFVMAYNAALKLCTILLYSSGFRTTGPGAHEHTIKGLKTILGDQFEKDADYLDSCRTRRNHAEYKFVDVAKDEDVEELIQFVEELKMKVLEWLKENRSDLSP